MKSKLFFLSLSTALAICANANAATSISKTYEIVSVSDWQAEEGSGEEVKLDLSTFLENARFEPTLSDSNRPPALSLKSNDDGSITIRLNGFDINMKTPRPFNKELSFDDNREEYMRAVLEVYNGLHSLGLLDMDEDAYQDWYREMNQLADQEELCDIECIYQGLADAIYGWDSDDYYDTLKNQDSGNQSESDNGGSDSNNSNQGSNNGEETNPDTGSSSGTGSSTGSGSGTISGSGSSASGTTTMPTGHRTFYAPAEAAADVHEGKDNTVIISF